MMACMVKVVRPNGMWCAIPSEINPYYIRGVIESQAVLTMDESMNKEFAKKLRSDHGLLQVMHMHQRPGNQCLSWIKGDLIMLPPIAFPKTYGVKNCPMLARYHLERWRKSNYLHLTETDWMNFTNPIFISQTAADEWMRSATGQVHDLSWDRRRDTKSDLPADQSTCPKDRRGDCLQNPLSREVR